MTTVTVRKNDNYIKISAKDHAYGSEKVCSAVSALVYSLEAWIINNPDKISKHECDMKSGSVDIKFRALTPDVYTALGFFIIGMAEIESSYEEFLSLDVSEEILPLVGVKSSKDP